MKNNFAFYGLLLLGAYLAGKWFQSRNENQLPTNQTVNIGQLGYQQPPAIDQTDLAGISLPNQ